MPEPPKPEASRFTPPRPEPPGYDPRPATPPHPLVSGTVASVAGNDVSVIGRDLTIIGQQITIVSQGSLKIDAEIQGDLRSVELVIGEHAKVFGTVAAESVVVRGAVTGAVRGLEVFLQAGAHVDGDIHYKSLTVDRDAIFEGRSRRTEDRNELLQVGNGKAGEPKPLALVGGSPGRD